MQFGFYKLKLFTNCLILRLEILNFNLKISDIFTFLVSSKKIAKQSHNYPNTTLKNQIKTFIYNQNKSNNRCEVYFISCDEHQSNIL